MKKISITKMAEALDFEVVDLLEEKKKAALASLWRLQHSESLFRRLGLTAVIGLRFK